MSEQLAQQQMQSLFSQLAGISGIEQGLFGLTSALSGQELSARQGQAGLVAQQEISTSELIGNLISGAALAYGGGKKGG